MTSRMLRLSIIILFLATLFASVFFTMPANAQTGEFPTSAEYTFGKEVIFHGEPPAGLKVDTATIYFMAEGELKTRSGLTTVLSDGKLYYAADMTGDPMRRSLQWSTGSRSP